MNESGERFAEGLHASMMAVASRMERRLQIGRV